MQVEAWRVFILFPKEVDVAADNYPITNWIIIGLIIVVFGFQVKAIIDFSIANQDKKTSQSAGFRERGDEDAPHPWDKFKPYFLDGWNLKGIFGHMWLHGGIFHLLGNLVFLWVFGNAVCSKIGNIRYIFFYLLVGFFSASAHLLFSDGAAIGASGAINGVVGMFFIFFAENEVTCGYFVWMLFLYVGTFTIKSFWMILVWLAFDISGVVLASGSIAYYAHLGGFFAGAGIAIAMLKTGLVKTEKWDGSIFDLFKAKKPEADTSDLYAFGGLLVRDIAYIEQSEAAREKELSQTIPVAAKRETRPAHIASTRPRVENATLGPAKLADKGDGFIRFYCECGKRLKVPESNSGKKGFCPQCKNKILVP